MKMISKGILLSALTSFCMSVSLATNVANDPVIITIDGNPIYKSEFEYVYNKNNSVTSADKKSLDEYADLFVNYKLKVLDAKNNGYDKNNQYLDEFRKYREQLAIPYIIDETEKNRLVKEAYDRSKISVAASHILIKYDHKDSIPAQARITKIYNELKAGAKFEELAKKYSDCPSSKQGGYLGYVNVFDMVYPFEDEVYNTPVGKFSEPFRTQFGFHIVYVSDKKPAVNRVKVSQIFTSSAKGKAVSDSLFNVVSRKGVDFNKVSAANSESFFNGTKDGRLPWISKSSIQIMPTEVVRAALDLSKTGQMTQVYTNLGYLILRLDSSNLDLSYNQAKEALTEKVLQSDRAYKISDKFLSNLAQRYSYELLDSSALYAFVPLINNDDFIGRRSLINTLNKPLYTLDDETHSQADFYDTFEKELFHWKEYLVGRAPAKEVKRLSVYGKSDSLFIVGTYNNYIQEQLTEYAYSELEKNNSDYRNLLNEYSDGLLLFDISQGEVWSKAVHDNGGLNTYFKANRSKYKWDKDHFVGRVIYCQNEKVKRQLDKFMEQFNGVYPDTMDNILEKNFSTKKKDDKGKPILKIHIVKGPFVQGGNKAVDYYVFKVGTADSLGLKDYPVPAIYGNVTKDPTDFYEFRGQLVTDYQNSLEQKWIEKLRNDHHIEINKDVLHSISTK